MFMAKPPARETRRPTSEPAPCARGVHEAAWWILCALCLTFACVALLLPITGTEFRHDDFDWLSAARSWQDEGRAWHSPTGLTILWDALFLAVYKSARMSPAPYYWLLIGLHVLASCSVLWAVREMGGSRLVALLCAAWFALLWQHHEVVTWIAVGYRPLALLFSMLCVGSFARHRRTGHTRWLFASALCALLALLCKEDALPIILLLLAFDALFKSSEANKNPRFMLKSYAPFALAYAIYIGFRVALAAPGGGAVSVGPGMYWPGWHMIPNTILCVPQMLIPDPGFATYQNMLARVGVGLTLLPGVRAIALAGQIALSGLAVLALCGVGRASPTVRFCLAWCFLAFLPFAPFVYGLARAPRYLYVGSFGLCLLLALATESLWKTWRQPGRSRTKMWAGVGLSILALGLVLNVPVMRRVISNRLRDSQLRRAIAQSTRTLIPQPIANSRIYLLNVPPDIEDVAKGIALLYPKPVRCEAVAQAPRAGWPPDSYVVRFWPEDWSRPKLVQAPPFHQKP